MVPPGPFNTKNIGLCTSPHDVRKTESAVNLSLTLALFRLFFHLILDLTLRKIMNLFSERLDKILTCRLIKKISVFLKLLHWQINKFTPSKWIGHRAFNKRTFPLFCWRQTDFYFYCTKPKLFPRRWSVFAAELLVVSVVLPNLLKKSLTPDAKF